MRLEKITVSFSACITQDKIVGILLKEAIAQNSIKIRIVVLELIVNTINLKRP